MSERELEGKVAIITGAGKAHTIPYGVGRAFAKAGADIAVIGRNASRLKAARELEEFGVQVLPVRIDNLSEQSISKAASVVFENFGRLDILVNTTIVAKTGDSFVRQTDADFSRAFETGPLTAARWMRACHEKLAVTHGSVINFSSTASVAGLEGQASYAAAREAITAMSRVVAREWAPEGINVNVVCPLAATGNLERWKKDFPEVYEGMEKQIPMGHFGDPELDIGRTCVFLASEAASYITGQVISVSGGM